MQFKKASSISNYNELSQVNKKQFEFKDNNLEQQQQIISCNSEYAYPPKQNQEDDVDIFKTSINTCPEHISSNDFQEIITLTDQQPIPTYTQFQNPSDNQLKKRQRQARILSMSLYQKNKWKLNSEEKEDANDQAFPPEQCVICFSAHPNAVLMECGHGGICTNCAMDLWKQTAECFLCRKSITSFYEIEQHNENSEYIKVISETYYEKEQLQKIQI